MTSITLLLINLIIFIFSAPPPPQQAAPAPSAAVDTGLVASYGGDSDDEEDPSGMEALDESKLVDWDKLACLLCKRQFPQKETLQKHLTKSGLHKVRKIHKYNNYIKYKRVENMIFIVN